MLKFHRALYELSVVGDVIVTGAGERFDRESYARFKYGYLPPAQVYGEGLARQIEDELFFVTGNEPIVIISAPYKHLPTASQAIAEVLLRELSQMAIDREIEPPQLAPFHKDKMGDDSYANSSEADRLSTLATLGLRVDESLIRDAHVLVVDDIRITGSAEKVTAQYIETLGPKSVWYLHAARLPEDFGRLYPTLENELNKSVPNGLRELHQDMVEMRFQLNTRVLRHILQSDPAHYEWFMQHAPTRIMQQMYDAAVGNGLDYYRRCQTQLERLRFELNRRTGRLSHAAV